MFNSFNSDKLAEGIPAVYIAVATAKCSKRVVYLESESSVKMCKRSHVDLVFHISGGRVVRAARNRSQFCSPYMV